LILALELIFGAVLILGSNFPVGGLESGFSLLTTDLAALAAALAFARLRALALVMTPSPVVQTVPHWFDHTTQARPKEPHTLGHSRLSSDTYLR
jgi:hypothetical protein